jgi:quinol monooxygenase YgiN
VSITVVLDMKIKAELFDEFMANFEKNLPDSRNYEGCVYVNVTHAKDEPHRIVAVEGWASEESFLAYGAWRREAGDAEAFMKYYDGAPSLTILEPIEI